MLGQPDGGQGCALVVGLGNPGRSYRGTRHNAGRIAAERLLKRSRVLANGRWPGGRLWLAESEGRRFLVLEPSTFMNLSGQAVCPVINAYGIEPGRVLLIHDDIDLPLGDVRLKEGGGAGGHRGLTSIFDAAGTREFSRVRIGVGRPPEGTDAADHVLDRFEPGEAEIADRSIGEAADVALSVIGGR